MQRGCAGRSWELLHVWQVINDRLCEECEKTPQTDTLVLKFRACNILNVANNSKKHNLFFLGRILVHLALISCRVILLFCGINTS